MESEKLSLIENNILFPFLLDLLDKKLNKKYEDYVYSTMYYICAEVKE